MVGKAERAFRGLRDRIERVMQVGAKDECWKPMAGQLEEAAKTGRYQALNIRETEGERMEESMNGNVVLSFNMS